MSNVIDTSTWKEFRIEELFDVVKGSRLTVVNRVSGDIPYAGASQFDNGITHFIGNDENLHPAGVLTVCYNGPVGTTFYQNQEFWATDDVNVLYPKFTASKDILMFIAPIIESVGLAYAYIDKWKLEDMKSSLIKLPVTSDGEPDWGYMERTMQRVMAEQEQNLEALIAVRDRPKTVIDSSDWGEFDVENIADIVTGAMINRQNLEDGVTPRISVSGVNNGVIGLFNSNDKNHRVFAKFVSVSFLGAIFWQSDEVSLEMKVHGIKPKNVELSDEAGLMFAASIEASIAAWRANSYGDQISSKSLKQLKLRLPQTADGDPDWGYMEQMMSQVVAEREQALGSLQTITNGKA